MYIRGTVAGREKAGGRRCAKRATTENVIVKQVYMTRAQVDAYMHGSLVTLVGAEIINLFCAEG